MAAYFAFRNVSAPLPNWEGPCTAGASSGASRMLMTMTVLQFSQASFPVIVVTRSQGCTIQLLARVSLPNRLHLGVQGARGLHLNGFRGEGDEILTVNDAIFERAWWYQRGHEVMGAGRLQAVEGVGQGLCQLGRAVDVWKQGGVAT